jgi:hypothetical protein
LKAVGRIERIQRRINLVEIGLIQHSPIKAAQCIDRVAGVSVEAAK